MKRNINKLNGFSLVELLVGLIIISLLVTAFIPLITKKLKASDITVGSFGNSSGNGAIGVKRDITKKDCEKMNAVFIPKEETGTKNLCVMKYNAGDGYYTSLGESWNGIQKCNTGNSCSVANGASESATKDNLTPTCWVGQTADSTCNSNYSNNYGGCYRTVCNWTGANQMCNNMDGWRLATDKELDSFTNSTYSSSSLGASGLMFCDYSTSSTTAPICHVVNSCLGAHSNSCDSDNLWSSSFTNDGGTIAYNRALNAKWLSLAHTLGRAFSTRCVKDYVIDSANINDSGTIEINSKDRDVTREDCTRLNTVFIPKEETGTKNLCVMKYNAGDGYYASLGESFIGVQKCNTGFNCSVSGSSKDNLTPTCWQGATANASYCNSNFGGYSGCNRTVCNWNGANKLCENMGWRLPTDKELDSFTNNTYSSSLLGVSGLMLCDQSTSSTTEPMCNYAASCPGSYDNRCYPHHLWSVSFNDGSESLAYSRRLNVSWGHAMDYLDYAFSARCVLDKITENVLAGVKSCKNGYHFFNGECYPDIKNCTAYNGESCTQCKDGYALYLNECKIANETNCYDFFCNKCIDKTNGTCATCKEGYVLYEGKCYFGTLEGCNNPIYDETYQRINCSNCKAGYTKCNSGSCRLTSVINNGVCPVNTIKIGCSCVAKYNIGDSANRYSEKWNGVQKCTTASSCSVTNGKDSHATAHNLQPTCWNNGYTGNPSYCNDNYGGYSGCNRTVCNWTGANQMCNNIGWRLPTMPELTMLTSVAYSSNALTSNGLMLCDYSTSSTTAPICYLVANCLGSYDNDCRPYYLWSSSFSSESTAYDRHLNDSWYSSTSNLGLDFSVRCVKDL